MYKALIIDDEPLILKGLMNIVNWEEYGIEIAGLASNGAEALNIIENTIIQLLITDIKMPEIDGLELLRRIKQKGLNIKCIILSGYDDFILVKEAAKLGIENYLLKPVIRDELSSTLLNIVQKIESELNHKIQLKKDLSVLRNNILCRWLNNNISYANLSERAGLLNIDLNCEKYVVCLTKAIKGDSLSTINNNVPDKGLINFAIENINNEIIPKDCKVITLCDLNDNVVSIFYGKDDSFDIFKLRLLLQECMVNINRYLKCDVIITIGSCENESKLLYKSYSHAIKLLEYSLILPKNTIVDYEETVRSKKSKQGYFNFNFEPLKTALTSKNREMATGFIDVALKSLSHIEGITPLNIQSASIEILYTIISVLNIQKIDSTTLFDSTNNLFLQLINAKSIDELSELLKSIIHKTIDRLSAENENTNPLIKRVLNYLNSNYASNLSLKILSDSFNVNAAYLGQLFIKETNETFSNYLNKLRIEKAQELLVNTKMDLNEIAEKVGYINQSYFCNLFKKITGVYPTKYKINITEINKKS